MTDAKDVEGPRRPKIFLSYTRADIDHARRIISLLEQAGIEVWWDGLLEGGVTYLSTTEAALEGAECVVVLWSERSVGSNWVRDEAQSGRERGCLVPLSLDGSMAPLGFRQIQLIDISAWDGDPQADEAQSIIAAVQRQTGGEASAKPSTTPSPPTAGAGISRRALAIGGLGLAGGAAALGAWQMGLFSAPAQETNSMAVLRFVNLSADAAQSWFSDGLSSELRQVLARNPKLRVSAPTSSLALEDEDDFEIGRALGVRNILRGSVQLVDDVVRIVTELVRVGDGLVIWSSKYDREFADVLALQSEIAETVAFELVEAVGDSQVIGGTENVLAYEAYLRGIALRNLSAGVDSDRAALAHFDTAIELDPGYAAAHSLRSTMLASIANATGDADEVNELFDQSIASAQKSIELEPELASGHLALGFAYNNGKLDPAAAYPYYKRAEEIAPGDADTQRSVAMFYAYGDQTALAMQMIKRVLELDPLNARAFRGASYVALLSGDYAATIEYMDRALELNPDLASAYYAIANAKFMLGDIEGAREAFEKETIPSFSQTGLAITLFKLGDTGRAQEIFDQLLAEFGDAVLYQQVQIQAQWGNTDEALKLLTRAFEKPDPGVLLAPNDPLLNPLRAEPEFDRLLLQLSS